jgi:hypothetical protein
MGIVDSQEQYDERTFRLARSLGIVAALIVSFKLGQKHGYWLGQDNDDMTPQPWFPGCGRDARGG